MPVRCQEGEKPLKSNDCVSALGSDRTSRTTPNFKTGWSFTSYG